MRDVNFCFCTELPHLFSTFWREEILAEDDAHQDGQEDSDEEMMDSDEAEMNFVHYNKCISGEQFTETDEEDGQNQVVEDMEGNDSDGEEVMCEEDI